MGEDTTGRGSGRGGGGGGEGGAAAQVGSALPFDVVRAEVARLGFAVAGVCEARASDHTAAYRDWIAAGGHGEMAYLARHVEARLDPTVLVPGAMSVIVVGDVYASRPGGSSRGDTGRAARHGESDEASRPGRTPARGRLARYGLGRDYHKVVKRRLHALCDALRVHWPTETYKACVDTAPVLEREHAARAGLGQVGKHTLLIHPELGSWLLLGCIVTTLRVGQAGEHNDKEDAPARTHPRSDAAWPRRPATMPHADAPVTRWGDSAAIHEPATFCGGCTRCIDACPTDAITPYALDATRCISYLTLEHRGPIEERYHAAMGDWIGGCDICQEVCPYNRKDSMPHSPTRHPLDDYAPREPLASGLSLADVLAWHEGDYRDALSGSALKRMKYEMVLRNALIAAGNALATRHDPELRQRVEALADATSPLLRDTACQVLARLNRPAGPTA